MDLLRHLTLFVTVAEEAHFGQAADKTGSGRFGSLNDVAITWPNRDTPILIAALSDKSTVDAKANNALLAEAAKAVVEALTR